MRFDYIAYSDDSIKDTPKHFLQRKFHGQNQEYSNHIQTSTIPKIWTQAIHAKKTITYIICSVYLLLRVSIENFNKSGAHKNLLGCQFTSGITQILPPQVPTKIRLTQLRVTKKYKF